MLPELVTDKAEDLDVWGLAGDELEASLQVFYVRRGRVMGRKGFVVESKQPWDHFQRYHNNVIRCARLNPSDCRELMAVELH